MQNVPFWFCKGYTFTCMYPELTFLAEIRMWDDIMDFEISSLLKLIGCFRPETCKFNFLVPIWLISRCHQQISSLFNPFGAEYRIFSEITMAVDAPAPVARSSAAMDWYWLYKQVLPFYDEEFQLPVPSHCQEMMENWHIYFSYFQK